MSDFFEKINSKLGRKPTRLFDNTFWKKFESEFEPQSKSNWNFSDWLKVFAPVGAVALGLFFLYRGSVYQGPSHEMLTQEFAVLLEEKELYSNLDLLIEFETLEDLDEKEWAFLLAEENG